MSNQFDGQCFRCFSGAEECASKGCGGAAPRIHPDQRAAFYATVAPKSASQMANDKAQLQQWVKQGALPSSILDQSNEYQPCGHCKGKGVPAHRPFNCRDRLNPKSRFYEAPSAEQERMDRRKTQKQDHEADDFKTAIRTPAQVDAWNAAFKTQADAWNPQPQQPFSFGGFAYPPKQMPQFNFQPIQSAFIPGGGRCITPPRPASPFNFFKGYAQMADGSWVPEK